MRNCTEEFVKLNLTKVMTAKEKAKELFDKYCYTIRTEETDSGYFTNVLYAKQCALIAVDEIIKNQNYIIEQYELKLLLNGVRVITFSSYWYEVKLEIEKL